MGTKKHLLDTIWIWRQECVSLYIPLSIFLFNLGIDLVIWIRSISLSSMLIYGTFVDCSIYPFDISIVFFIKYFFLNINKFAD